MTLLKYQAISCDMCGKFLCWTRQDLEAKFICNNCKVYIIRRQNGLYHNKELVKKE